MTRPIPLPSPSNSAAVESLETRTLLAAGALDPTFGTGGLFVPSPDTPPGFLLPTDVAVQSDGKLLFSGVGLTDVGTVVRLNADGTVDTSFGSGGLANSGFGPYQSNPNALAVGPQGKIAIAGFAAPFQNEIPRQSTLVVYTAAGKPDTSFSGDGVLNAPQFPRGFSDVAFQSDGKILALGEKLVRFNANGTPDTTFGGGDGIADVSGKRLLIDANGKVVVLGYFALFRFNADGTPDKSFDGDGVLGGVKGSDVALAPDGDLLLVGNGAHAELLSRFNDNGTPDLAFGNKGSANVPAGQSLAVTAADIYVGDTTGDVAAGTADFEIRALTQAGKPDAGFGTNGRVQTDVAGKSDVLVTLAIQNGKLAALGSTQANTGTTATPVTVPAIARYDTAGSVTPPGGQSPFGTTPIALPGTIEAENFDRGGERVAYHDLDTANLGGNNYRPGEGVDLQTNADTAGGASVAFAQAGEFLEYTVNVPAGGTFDVDFRVAHLKAGGTFHLDVDGVNATGALHVPQTGDWNKYATVTKTGVKLTGGTHVLRLSMDANGAIGYVGNFNWIRFRQA